MDKGAEPEVLWRIEGAAGIIVLNRPAALNALTLNMVREMGAALDIFERDARITRVIVRGAGQKAFCAGGDIRRLYEQGRAGDHDAQLVFWHEEYILNMRIKRFPKPYISLINGIVMGGGVGISQHGAWRIGSETYVFAMPEVGIGFFPDVGATYFLPRLPYKVGTMLALTGARVKAADALAFGLVDSIVPEAKFDLLQAALGKGLDVDRTLSEYALPLEHGPYFEQRSEIAGWFAGQTASAILDKLKASGLEMAQGFAKDMTNKSPLSVCIAAEQMRIGPGLDFNSAMKMEFRVVSRICKEADFYEGVRCVLIERGAEPRWHFAGIADVPSAKIADMFAPLPENELN